MKTNMIDLMSKIKQMQNDITELGLELKLNSTNEKIIELNGSEQILKENKDFDMKFNQYISLLEKVSKFQGIVATRNAMLKLKNGMSIQEALIRVKNLRTEFDIVKALASRKPYKKRTTETTNSYFTATELAYDKEIMINKREDLITEIQELEFEISQLNSQEFEV